MDNGYTVANLAVEKVTVFFLIAFQLLPDK